jgi:hypothetical protein
MTVGRTARFEHRVATTVDQCQWLIEVAPFDDNTKDCALVVFFLGVLYTHKADWH